MRRRPTRFQSALVVLTLTSALVPAVLSSSAHADDPSWQSYVLAPTDPTMAPVAVTSTSGSVDNANALATPSASDAATLTYTSGGVAPVVVLDFGKEVGGATSFTVTSATGNPTMQVGYSETLTNLTSSGDFVNSNQPTAKRYDSFTVTGAGTLSGSGIQGGERYELITLTSPGSVTLGAATIKFSGFLGTAQALRGHFLSSDDELNRIWYAGVYTVNLDQLPPNSPAPVGDSGSRKLLVDGAKRDRSVWSGDIYATGPAIYAALDPAYVRDSLTLLGQWPATNADSLQPAIGLGLLPGPMPAVCQPSLLVPVCLTYSMSYSTIFVPAVADYFRHTADKAFVANEWLNISRVLAWNKSQIDANGLLATTANNGRDWHGTGPALAGEVTWNNVLGYMALTDGADLADALGKSADAASYRQQAQALAAAINAHLWNASTGVYDISDSIRGAVSQDANAFAVLAGIATPARSQAILSKLQTALVNPRGNTGYADPVPAGLVQNISPFMSGYQILADFSQGRTASALELMKREWGYMLATDPSSTTWEDIPLTGSLAGSESAAHAWGSLPTAALTQYVLGVQPTSAGFATFQVAPQPGDVSWAQGEVPTPRGPIDVSWSRPHACGFDISILVPSGTTASVTVPNSAAAPNYKLDGTTTMRSNTGNLTVSGLGAGQHRIEVPPC